MTRRGRRTPPTADPPRERARTRVGALEPASLPTAADAHALVEELKIHQVELELQNDELRRTRRELEHALERYTELYELAPVGYLTLDRAGIIQVANVASARLFGREQAELVTEYFGALVADPVAFERLLEQARASDATRSAELPLSASASRDTGRVIRVELSSSSATGEHRAVVLDVTEQRLLEERLRAAHGMEVIGQLAGGVAHDFNNMLQVVLTNLDLALGEVTPKLRRAVLLEAQERAMRAATLTRQLLALGRRQVLRPERLDLSALVRGLAEMLRRVVGAPILLELDLGSDVPEIAVDRAQLEQVVLNLVVNARDAMLLGGTLTIVTARDVIATADGGVGVAARLTVRDTGAGMDAATLVHACEPYFTTKSTGQGSGLGLATVHGVVEQCRGRLVIRSEPGVGTSVDVILPRTVPSSAPEVVPGDASSIPPPVRDDARRAPPRTGRGETILVIDDEPAIVRAVARMLRGAGYVVLTADGPNDAVRVSAAHAGAIDLFVCDVIMPELNGPELVSRLRASRTNARVLYVSGYPGDVLGRQGLIEPSVRVLSKPFARDALVAEVRAALDADADALRG